MIKKGRNKLGRCTNYVVLGTSGREVRQLSRGQQGLSLLTKFHESDMTDKTK